MVHNGCRLHQLPGQLLLKKAYRLPHRLQMIGSAHQRDDREIRDGYVHTTLDVVCPRHPATDSVSRLDVFCGKRALGNDYLVSRTERDAALSNNHNNVPGATQCSDTSDTRFSDD